MYENMRVF